MEIIDDITLVVEEPQLKQEEEDDYFEDDIYKNYGEDIGPDQDFGELND